MGTDRHIPAGRLKGEAVPAGFDRRRIRGEWGFRTACFGGGYPTEIPHDSGKSQDQ